MNLIYTKARNSIELERIDKIVFIYINVRTLNKGKHKEEFDKEDLVAIKDEMNAKQRIYNTYVTPDLMAGKRTFDEYTQGDILEGSPSSDFDHFGPVFRNSYA